jgi:signal transduction histidine kinase
MKVYNFLSTIPRARKNYALKFFIITLPLILFPVAELLVFKTVFRNSLNSGFIPVVVTVVIITIILSAAILYFFNRLLSPLLVTNKALNNYISFREIPKLPEDREDEVGVLMSNIQTTLTRLDGLLSEKSDMIDLLSHDLRSPVGRIISLSNLIKIDNETDKNLYADYIANECRGLLRLLENILLMLKEDGHVFRLESTNLRQLVQDTVSFFEFPISEKNLHINIAIDESLFVSVQKDLFTQAVRNIIGNAVKFSSDGKSINIAARQNNEEISLSIQDEGIGFVPSDIKKIFERFTNSGKKGTHGEASVGLGLYLSKKIVEKHGGKLNADSDGVNKGATFTIILYRLITKKRQSKLRDSHGRQLEFFNR